MNQFSRTYEHYKKTFDGRELPFAFVDLDLYDENARNIRKRAGSKKIRIASKSIRCVELLKRVLKSDESFQGLMCYAISEAIFLAEKGFDDLLVGYPCAQEAWIAAACKKIKEGKTIVLMIDSPDHVKLINRIAEQHDVVVPLCLDLDMSSRFPGLHFGVHRSSVSNTMQALKVWEIISSSANVRLDGLMGYEAQIAGVGDNVAGQKLKNGVIRFLKKKSVSEISKRRGEVVKALENAGAKFRFVNGGGTGSLETTREEPWVTEVAAGSGLYSSGLFDNYSTFKHYPAAGFAIEVVRKPKAGMLTCHGGGYIASGGIGKDKQPIPYLPEGLKLTENEGTGEVQTPMYYSGNINLEIGNQIFMRHSKAGELCERFNTLLLVSDGKIVDEVQTYRGEGKCFL